MRRLDARGDGLEAAVAEACRVVAGGGVVIFPTDTVYGIGCQPSHPAAVERIYALKGRPREKPLALHFASVEYMLEYAPGDARVLALARRFLPGPLTIVVKRPATVDASIVAGLPTLGLRVPEHATCAALLARCGPLAATSANLSDAPAFTGRESPDVLPQADLFVDAGPAPVGVASTVVDLSQGDVRLIREGAVPFDAIVRACA
jgi:L-threonylcarbamoyladenylate synthase